MSVENEARQVRWKDEESVEHHQDPRIQKREEKTKEDLKADSTSRYLGHRAANHFSKEKEQASISAGAVTASQSRL